MSPDDEKQSYESRIPTVPSQRTGFVRRHLWHFAAFAGIIALLVILLSTSAIDRFDEEWVSDTFERIRGSRGGIAAVFIVFVMLAIAGMPLTPLVGASGALLPFYWAFPVSFVGAAVTATVHYMLGQMAPQRLRDRIGTPRVKHMMARVQKRGVLAVVILRKIPLGPYFVVSITCGMTGVPYAAFILGTMLSILPGMIMLSLFGRKIGSFLQDPTWEAALVAVGAGVIVVVLALIMDRLMSSLGDEKSLVDVD